MLNTEAINYKIGDVIDHTPAAALTAGQMLQVGGRAAMAVSDIAAGVLGAIQVVGIIKVNAAAVTGNEGDNVYWDENGTPVGGSTTGAATTIGANGDFWIGTLTADLAATDGIAKVKLNDVNQSQPQWSGKVHETKSVNYTIDAEDAGKVIHVDTDAVVITLPDVTTVPGLRVIIVNDGADGAVEVSISPNANDKIMGPDIAGTDNKDQINTKATAIKGDFMEITGEGVAGWWIENVRGTWAEEAA